MYELLSIWFSVNKLPTKVERQVLKNYIKAWKKVIIIHEKWNQNLSEKVSDENWLTLPIKKISSLKWVSVNVQSNLCWLIWLPPILDRYLKEREKLHKLFSIQRTHKIQEWSQDCQLRIDSMKKQFFSPNYKGSLILNVYPFD